MGEMNDKPFRDICINMFSTTEWETKSVELCSLWQHKIQDSGWYPYKHVTIDKKAHCRQFCMVHEVINENDEKLREMLLTLPFKSILALQGGKVLPGTNETLGKAFIKSRGIFTDPSWYWIRVGALLGCVLIFNMFFTLALTYLNPFTNSQAVISDDSKTKKAGEEMNPSVVVSPLTLKI